MAAASLGALFGFCTFRNAFQKVPQNGETTVEGLAKALGRFRVFPGVGDDKQARSQRVPLWSPAVYAEGAKREAVAVSAVSCLVLDYDDGTPLEAALAPWEGVCALWHSSWNHRPDHPRFRLVFPLDQPVLGEMWGPVWMWASLNSAGKPDKACKDPSRMYFVPALREEGWPAFAGNRLDKPFLRIPDDVIADLAERESTRPAYRPPPPKRQHGNTQEERAHWEELKEIRYRLKTEPRMREEAAHRLGVPILGTGNSRRAKGATCPQCGRPSVWWPITPSVMGGAACDHRNSCDWIGWLDTLLGIE